MRPAPRALHAGRHRSTLWIAVLVAVGLCLASAVRAQCLLANPSFELTGSGTAFAGWNQFGPTGSSSEALHGRRAARVSGPNTGAWDVSGFWQGLDTSPGQAWVAAVHVWNTSSKPLSGGSTALLNVEWRDAGGNLISYESHTVADASTPTEAWFGDSIVTAAAPAGASQVRLLLGVLQGPGDPQPEVRFDHATLEPAGPPAIEDIQWNDFPGGRTIHFSGREWRVKGPGYFGPGPNLFCDSGSCVWVDAGGRLHLTLQNSGGQWYSSEVAATELTGYGDYVFTTVGRLDLLDPAVVFGLFTWQYGPCYDPGYLWWNPFNEIDVEFGRWGSPSSDIAQFVAQPFDYPGNTPRFDASFSIDELTSHAFHWLADRVEFRSWRGGPLDESPGNMIRTWTYTGPHVPRPEHQRVHVNLWRFAGPPASNQEVVLDAFTFVPEDPGVVAVEGPGSAHEPDRLLEPLRPHPVAGSAHIRYALPREGRVELAIFDVAGRRVRTLSSGFQPAGPHEATWDGFDASGLRATPGVYLVRLSTGQWHDVRRLVLLR
jgi:FlgD Ig-like domain